MLRNLALLVVAAAAPLAVSAQTSIIDATKSFVKSSEATYDHEVILVKGELSFHWNDVAGNTFEGRLIHTAPSIDEAPSWVAVGFYDVENNSNFTATTEFMVGSDAIIGLVDSGIVQKYALAGKKLAATDGVHPLDRQTLVYSSIVQHNADDRTVTTVLSFEKLLEESDTYEVRLLNSGANVLLWAFGPPGTSELAKHTSKGAFTLDFAVVQSEAEGSGNSTAVGSSSDGTQNVASVVEAECGSNLEAGYLMIPLIPEVSFHWKLDGNTFSGILQYEGEGWLGWGFSKDGTMIGGTAIIGIPNEGVDVRELNDKSIQGISVSNQQNLIESSITQEKGITQLRFKKALDTVPVINNGENTFIFAIGESNQFGYHQHRSALRVKDLVSCTSTPDSTDGASMTNLGAFAAHGTIATLAWGIASPFALTVAWFRTLVPSSWIYIHVFSNVISFFFTLISVIVAVSAMSVQPAGVSTAHFSDPHHWVGLVLLVAVTFQVMNGFLRPPVEKKDPYATSHNELEKSLISCPRTPREIWYFSHRTTGIAMLAMGIYQIQSGLNLFAADFYVTSIAPWFWGYVGLFAFCLISLKFWIMFEEYKARRGMEAMHVDHRSAGGSSSGGISHTDSELVPVQFDMS